eukprot:gene4379-20601_t
MSDVVGLLQESDNVWHIRIRQFFDPCAMKSGSIFYRISLCSNSFINNELISESPICLLFNYDLEYEFLGCWKGTGKISSARQFATKSSIFGPLFRKFSSQLSHEKVCRDAASKRGLDTFVIAKDGCRGGAHTGLVFRRYGKSDLCDSANSRANPGRVFGRGGMYVYNEERKSPEHAVYEPKSSIYKKQEIARTFQRVNREKVHPEIIKKDIILMNKIFNRFYGNVYKNRESYFMKAYPDSDHFNSYYGDEADTYETSTRSGNDKTPKFRKNLFVNPGFEDPLTHSTWNCLGELNHGTGGIMSRTAKHKRTGRYAGVCHSRNGFWAGPGQFVGHVVKPGHAYKVHGWTKLLNASDEDLYHIELWIRYQGNEVKNSTETRILLAKRDQYNNNKWWQEWNGQFFLPSHKKGFNYVQILFKGPKHHVDIVIDDMVLEEMPLEEDWLQEVKARTEKLRKRDATIRIKLDSDIIPPEMISQIRIKVTQKRHHFGFGSAVNHSPLKKIPEYRRFFVQNFEWGVPESAMKWNIMEAKKGEHVHSLMDDFVSTLNKYNISMRGHCIFWDVGTETPKWLDKLSKKELRKALENRIDDTVGKYKKRIAHWDVNNEMVHGAYFAEKLGPEIRDWMYKTVREKDPNSKLFMNDFDVVANGIYTQSYLEQIKGFRKRGVPVHGIGVQGHFLGWMHPSIIQERLDILAKAGLPIWITELDILEKNETKRAKALEHVMRVAFSHPSVAGIILWAFWSSAAWRGADTALIDDNFRVS